VYGIRPALAFGMGADAVVIVIALFFCDHRGGGLTPINSWAH